MEVYLSCLRSVVQNGVRQKNRTGIDTFMVPGMMMSFDLARGFPILTTKKVAFKSVVAELIAFIRGYDHAALFRKLGTTIWDANANQNEAWLKNPNRRHDDDLGRIYGVQWRRWAALPLRKVSHSTSYESTPIDQLKRAVHTLRQDPTSRRIIVTAWNPAELDRMALPPCHLLFQLLVEQETKKLHMTMYMRSCDMFLGVPFNISSYALLLAIIATATDYTPGTLTMFLADAHIYENHLPQVQEQLGREPRPLPRLGFVRDLGPHEVTPMYWIESMEPNHVILTGYDPHPAIKAEMAI